MSRLAYLSKSLAAPSTVLDSRKKQAIPKDMKTAIREDSDEDRDSDKEEEPQPINQDSKPKTIGEEMASEIISALINIVFEAEQNVVQDQIISDEMIRENAENIHKQRFVKIKLDNKKPDKSKFDTINALMSLERTDSKSFRQAVSIRSGNQDIAKIPATSANSQHGFAQA